MRLLSQLRRAPKVAQNAARDLRFGRLLGGTARTRFAHLGAFDTANSAYDDLPTLFGAAGVRADDVIVDVGCGKGRVINWLLRTHPGVRVVGIELDPKVCSQTARRLRRYPNVTVVCGDATGLLPADGTLFFLFNPFDETVLQRFAEAFLAIADDDRRIVYYNAKYVELFVSDPRFSVEEINLPGSHRSALVRASMSR